MSSFDTLRQTRRVKWTWRVLHGIEVCSECDQFHIQYGANVWNISILNLT